MTDDEVTRMAMALQAANASYRGSEHNLYAYWRHLAAAALAVLSATPAPARTESAP